VIARTHHAMPASDARAPLRRGPGRSSAGRPRGFTLVEVLVALAIMAILAAMAFRGIDALAHARDGAQGATDRTLKLNSGMSQFEYDISQMIDTQVVYPIDFHGNTLRLTRRSPAGVVLVVWTLQDGRWQRWASPPIVRIVDLQDTWMRTQQWTGISDGAVAVLEDVSDFQVYCYRNGWSNCQSSGNLVNGDDEGNVPGPPPSAPSAPSAPANNKPQTAAPTGIQVVLKMADGQLIRERELPPL
jgi:general secretion pathway protein J